LDKLNSDYLQLHKDYEWNFRESYMGDKTKDDDFTASKKLLEGFKTDQNIYKQVKDLYNKEIDDSMKIRL